MLLKAQRRRQDTAIAVLTTEMARNTINDVAELNACDPNSPKSFFLCVTSEPPKRRLEVSFQTWVAEKVAQSLGRDFKGEETLKLFYAVRDEVFGILATCPSVMSGKVAVNEPRGID